MSVTSRGGLGFQGGEGRGAARDRIRLDHNERLVPSGELVRLLSDIPGSALTQYPEAGPLEARLADRWGLKAAQVLATAGGDDAIDRICRHFLAGGREMVTVAPTFEMMPYFARLAGGRVREIPTLDEPAPVGPICDRLGPRTGLVAVISPHNPTGVAATVPSLLEIADALPEGAALLADLAYVDFADRDPTGDLLTRDNVIIVRTLSKAWGLAGLRVGCALGPGPAIEALRISGAPFPVAGPSLWMAERAVGLGDRVTGDYVAAVRSERGRLRTALRDAGLDPFPTEANFVLATSLNPPALHRRLLRHGIAVRRFPSSPTLIRITLPGDETIFRRLLSVIEQSTHDLHEEDSQ